MTLLDGPDPDRAARPADAGGLPPLAGRSPTGPACPGCAACVPVRIPVERFRLTRPWRRIWRAERRPGRRRAPAGRDPRAVRPVPALSRQPPRRERHGRHELGGLPRHDRRQPGRQPAGRMAPAGPLADRGEPDRSQPRAACPASTSSSIRPRARRSLGSLVILWHVAARARARLPYVYLGYWIAGSPKMAYKARFQPLEQLTARRLAARCRDG